MSCALVSPPSVPGAYEAAGGAQVPHDCSTDPRLTSLGSSLPLRCEPLAY